MRLFTSARVCSFSFQRSTFSITSRSLISKLRLSPLTRSRSALRKPGRVIRSTRQFFLAQAFLSGATLFGDQAVGKILVWRRFPRWSRDPSRGCSRQRFRNTFGSSPCVADSGLTFARFGLPPLADVLQRGSLPFDLFGKLVAELFEVTVPLELISQNPYDFFKDWLRYGNLYIAVDYHVQEAHAAELKGGYVNVGIRRDLNPIGHDYHAGILRSSGVSRFPCSPGDGTARGRICRVLPACDVPGIAGERPRRVHQWFSLPQTPLHSPQLAGRRECARCSGLP